MYNVLTFCYQHNLHSSQTKSVDEKAKSLFCYQHNLHSSQTECITFLRENKFCYQHNLHSSQTEHRIKTIHCCFATSIIYIVLKPILSALVLVLSFATSIIYIVLKPRFDVLSIILVLLPA